MRRHRRQRYDPDHPQRDQTYYVCCWGCKQAFNENPEMILAEYRERLAKRSADAK
jgi:hypothetical protein